MVPWDPTVSQELTRFQYEMAEHILPPTRAHTHMQIGTRTNTIETDETVAEQCIRDSAVYKRYHRWRAIYTVSRVGTKPTITANSNEWMSGEMNEHIYDTKVLSYCE